MILQSSNPNRHGQISLEQHGEEFYVYVPGFEDPWDFEDRASAQVFFDQEVKELAALPNWEMQAEYDELHGTENGGDPRCEMYRDAW